MDVPFEYRWWLRMIFSQKYNDIWNKVNNVLKIEFDNEPIHTKKPFKKMPKAGFNHTCLAVITIDSVIEKDEKDESTLKKKKKWLNVLLWTSNIFWFWRRIIFY